MKIRRYFLCFNFIRIKQKGKTEERHCNIRVLARSYLMTLYVIFPIHVNFPITSLCVLKATIHRKKTDLFYVTWGSFFFFSKICFYDIVYASCIWIFPFYHNLSVFFVFLFNYFGRITFCTRDSFPIFIRDFLFSNFPLIF